MVHPAARRHRTRPFCACGYEHHPSDIALSYEAQKARSALRRDNQGTWLRDFAGFPFLRFCLFCLYQAGDVDGSLHIPAASTLQGAHGATDGHAARYHVRGAARHPGVLPSRRPRTLRANRVLAQRARAHARQTLRLPRSAAAAQRAEGGLPHSLAIGQRGEAGRSAVRSRRPHLAAAYRHPFESLSSARSRTVRGATADLTQWPSSCYPASSLAANTTAPSSDTVSPTP